MDVNTDPPKASSGTKRPSSLQRTTSYLKKAKLDLSQDQLVVLDTALNSLSETHGWPALLNLARTSLDVKRGLLLSSCTFISGELSTKYPTAGFGPALSANDVRTVAEESEPAEHDKWLDALQKGMMERDWGDIITHRMLHATWRGQHANALPMSVSLGPTTGAS
jgi:hypothetical protein